jgi:hypothetical protein
MADAGIEVPETISILVSYVVKEKRVLLKN